MSNGEKAQRKSLYINRSVQGQLIVRSVMQWFFYMCAVLLTIVIWTVIRSPSQSAIALIYQAFMYFWPAIIASLMILPLFLYDMLKESNRIAGPIHRLKIEMQKFTNGEKVKELRFRDRDHWEEIAEEFNALVRKYGNTEPSNETNGTTADERESALV